MRGALFAIELHEEIERRKHRLLLAALAAAFLHMALLLLTILVAVVFWDTHRIEAIGAMAAVYLACGAAALVRLGVTAGTSPAPFAATLRRTGSGPRANAASAMSAALVRLAREKEFLLARSALCRLRLRCQTQSLRDGLPWNRAAHALSAAPSYRRLALGPVLSFVGLGRSASVIMQAGRIVVLARLVRSIIGGVRTLSGPAPRHGGQAQPELPG